MNKGKITEARWKRVRLTVRKMAIEPEALPRHFMMPNCLIPIHTAIRFPPSLCLARCSSTQGDTRRHKTYLPGNV